MTDSDATTGTLVCTIGHSTLPLEEFIGLLKNNDVRHVLDVRTVPRSRHNPQFNRDALSVSLQAAGVDYTHLPGLGGLRHTRPDSINRGWRNLSFRGYADYMQTDEFAASLQQMMLLARQQRCALMCAEAVPWRCHRSLIADALLVRGIAVQDIIGRQPCKPHRLTPFAEVHGFDIHYPAPAEQASTPP